MPLSISAMVSYSRSLVELCECLRGFVPKNADWNCLLGLANQTLTTPALIGFATRFKDHIPEDVYLYIREIFERNVARNSRLAIQLTEAVEAISDRGVTPLLLKGAATLATCHHPYGAKLMSDLDMVVLPHEVEATMQALLALGYCVHYVPEPGSVPKWHADLKRPNDVGMIDLQCELPGPAFFYGSREDIIRHYKTAQIGRGSAFIPSATYQALVLIIHDEFQDSGYWIGNIDLRHLVELRDLAASHEGIDWNMLVSLTPSKLARNALETQLLALSSLLGVDVPLPFRTRLVPRLQYRRRVAQAYHPSLRLALLPLALLDYPNYRRGPGATFEQEKGLEPRRWRLPKSDTVRFLLDLSSTSRAGKL